MAALGQSTTPQGFKTCLFDHGSLHISVHPFNHVGLFGLGSRNTFRCQCGLGRLDVIPGSAAPVCNVYHLSAVHSSLKEETDATCVPKRLNFPEEFIYLC